jgi:hypothetical protein
LHRSSTFEHFGPAHLKQMKPKQQNSETCLTLGLDLDGTIDEAPGFFEGLTHAWSGRVVIITFRSDRAKAELDLQRFRIRYDELILADSLEAKARIIEEQGIGVYFDDQPETLKHIPPSVNVMLVRNGGNFDFDSRLWVLSNKTGKLI